MPLFYCGIANSLFQAGCFSFLCPFPSLSHTLLFSCFPSLVLNPGVNLRENRFEGVNAPPTSLGTNCHPELVGVQGSLWNTTEASETFSCSWWWFLLLHRLSWLSVQYLINDVLQIIFLLWFSPFLPIPLSLPINCPFPFPPYHAFINN